MLNCKRNIELQSILRDFDKLISRIEKRYCSDALSIEARAETLHTIKKAKLHFDRVARYSEVIF